MDVGHNEFHFMTLTERTARLAELARHPSSGPGSRIVAAVIGGLAWLLGAETVLAHGGVALPPPSVADLLFGWSFEPALQMPLLIAVGLYVAAVRHVNAAHPSNPVPRARWLAFLAGMAAIEIALQSGIERYDTTLFWIHMAQHLLLTMVAAPLIALGAPITLLLRVARPELRKRLILPILHSLPVRIVGFPVVSWLLFAGVMWGSHLSPLFDRSLEDPFVHDLEHLAYLVTALLFWWPVVGLDPSPWRIPYPARALYVFLAMPQNTFLSLAILGASAPLYPHYATIGRTWDPSPLADQQLAAGLMWVVGDVMLFLSVLAAIVAWMRHEERATVRLDARLEAQRADLRARERRLAERRAAAVAARPSGRADGPEP